MVEHVARPSADAGPDVLYGLEVSYANGDETAVRQVQSAERPIDEVAICTVPPDRHGARPPGQLVSQGMSTVTRTVGHGELALRQLCEDGII